MSFKGGKIQTETSSLTTCLIGCFDERDQNNQSNGLKMCWDMKFLFEIFPPIKDTYFKVALIRAFIQGTMWSYKVNNNAYPIQVLQK